MDLEKVYRGMSDGAETIEANFKKISEGVIEKDGNQDITGQMNFEKEPTVNGKAMFDPHSTLTISSGFSNGITGWIKFERVNDMIVMSYSLTTTDTSGSWKEILPGNKIPDEYKPVNTVYGKGGISAVAAVGGSACMIQFAPDLIQFAAYNRSNGNTAFAGQCFGTAKNRGR